MSRERIKSESLWSLHVSERELLCTRWTRIFAEGQGWNRDENVLAGGPAMVQRVEAVGNGVSSINKLDRGVSYFFVARQRAISWCTARILFTTLPEGEIYYGIDFPHGLSD